MKKIVFFKTSEKRQPKLGEWYQSISTWDNPVTPFYCDTEEFAFIVPIVIPIEIDDDQNRHLPGLINLHHELSSSFSSLEFAYNINTDKLAGTHNDR